MSQLYLTNEAKIILDLCGGTGAWSKPYRDAGYDVRLITLPDHDVRLMKKPNETIYGVLAAPPCCHLAGSGARWWKEKGDEALWEALSMVDACIRIVQASQPIFWALENPVGRLVHYLGQPRLRFHPCDYGDPYTKYTCVWGDFNIPKKVPVEPKEGSKSHLYPPSRERKALRSITPEGFARAFFEVNQ
jgi:hypothetical protein